VVHRPLTSENRPAAPGICETPFSSIVLIRLRSLLLTLAVSVPGFALTLFLPETSGVSLEDIAKPSGISLEETAISMRVTGAPPLPVADPASVPLRVADQASAL